MTRQIAERDRLIVEFAKLKPDGISIKESHEYLEANGLRCSYKTVMRDFLHLRSSGRFEKLKSGLYRQTKEATEINTKAEILKYLDSLQVGDRVIETGNCGMKGMRGDVVASKLTNGVAVHWDPFPGETGRLTTSPTWGTRRVQDGGDDD